MQHEKTLKHVLLLYVSLDTGEMDVRRFSRNNQRLQKLVIRIYVSLDAWQIVVRGYSRKKWEVPLRQQSKILRHVLRISVSLAS